MRQKQEDHIDEQCPKRKGRDRVVKPESFGCYIARTERVDTHLEFRADFLSRAKFCQVVARTRCPLRQRLFRWIGSEPAVLPFLGTVVVVYNQNRRACRSLQYPSG